MFEFFGTHPKALGLLFAATGALFVYLLYTRPEK